MTKKKMQKRKVASALKAHPFFVLIRGFLTIVILLTLLAVGIHLIGNTTLIRQISTTAVNAQVQTQTIREENNAKKYTIDIQYPEVVNLPNPEVQQNINQRLLQIVQKEIQLFKIGVAEREQEATIPQDFGNSLQISYEAVQANSAIVSIAFTVSSFLAGSAHPNTYTVAFNYSVTLNQPLTLADIFSQNKGYVSFLSEYTQSELLQKNPENSDFIKEGTVDKPENFQTFLLSPAAFIVVFDPYTVAPYVDGIQKVNIPYTELRTFINPALF